MIWCTDLYPVCRGFFLPPCQSQSKENTKYWLDENDNYIFTNHDKSDI